MAFSQALFPPMSDPYDAQSSVTDFHKILPNLGMDLDIMYPVHLAESVISTIPETSNTWTDENTMGAQQPLLMNQSDEQSMAGETFDNGQSKAGEISIKEPGSNWSEGEVECLLKNKHRIEWVTGQIGRTKSAVKAKLGRLTKAKTNKRN